MHELVIRCNILHDEQQTHRVSKRTTDPSFTLCSFAHHFVFSKDCLTSALLRGACKQQHMALAEGLLPACSAQLQPL